MFWKRRNIIALTLILVCALELPLGVKILEFGSITAQETMTVNPATAAGIWAKNPLRTACFSGIAKTGMRSSCSANIP